jgi:O-acetyl-ADP-ribose deacetylase (regulator of RNase III)
MPIATLAPVEKTFNRTTVRLEQGDLTALPVDAFALYAREDLALGSGYGTAIQVRGGDAVASELKAIGRIQMGRAVLTTAGNMKAKKIIHACGPKFQEPDIEKKLRDCMLSALDLADRTGLRTVAFPAMGAGFYSVMLRTIQNFCELETSLERVIICVVDGREFAAFREAFDKSQTEDGGGPHAGRKPAAAVQ